MRTELLTLQAEHDDLKDAHSTLQRSTNLNNSNQKTAIQSLQHKLTLLQSEVTAYQERERENENIVRDLRSRLEEMNIGPQTSAGITGEDPNGGVPKDWEIVRSELRRQADYLRTLESTNTRLTGQVLVLKQRSENSEILKEEKRALERRLEGLDKLRVRCSELERELDASRQKAVDSFKSSTNSTQDLSTELSTLRRTHAQALEAVGSVKATLKEREVEITELENRIKELATKADNLRADKADLQRRAEKAERLLSVEKRERGFYQAMVSSFEAERSSQELSLGGSSDPVEPAESSSASSSREARERVTMLEQTIAELQAINEQIDKEMGELKRSGAKVQLDEERKKALATTNAFKTLETTHATALDKIEELEQTLFELRGTIAAGDHVPPGVRVLELADNPLRRWEHERKEVVDTLRKENAALLQKLEKAGGGGDGEDTVPKESWERLEKENRALEEVVKQRDKRLQRLQEVFRAKSSEFREAISSILGFKLAFYDNGQVRVTSQYDLGASFVFQPSSNLTSTSRTMTDPAAGGVRMQLIAQSEGGPQDMPNLMNYWVDKEGCIPGLMASVTLECWEAVKQSRKQQH